MYRSILVPLDGSSFGEHALPLAAGIARRAGAELKLLHVHTRDGEVELPTLTPYQFEGLTGRYQDRLTTDEEGAYLEGVCERLRQRAPVSTCTALLGGGTLSAALERYIRESDGDLLVMTTHARGALGRLWSGGVADDLVRHAGKPVLLIHAVEGEEYVLEEEPVVRRVLVALDGSPLAEQVLEPASDLARLLGAEVELFTVVTPAMAVAGAFGRPAGGGAGAAVQAAQEYLDRAAERLPGLVVDRQVAAGSDPAQGVLQAAALRGAGLIALATHGRGGLSRLVAGSVAEKVVRGTRTPVLLVRPAAQ